MSDPMSVHVVRNFVVQYSSFYEFWSYVPNDQSLIYKMALVQKLCQILNKTSIIFPYDALF